VGRDSVRGASLVNRSAVTELRNHAVRSWETKEASEEPGSAKRRVLQVAKRISNVQQIFGKPDAKSPAVRCI